MLVVSGLNTWQFGGVLLCACQSKSTFIAPVEGKEY